MGTIENVIGVIEGVEEPDRYVFEILFLLCCYYEVYHLRKVLTF